MAVTGTGTEQDPYIVHSYTELMTLSGQYNYGGLYAQFFEDEHPNQVIDCNDYGSEFKWHTFNGTTGYGGDNPMYLNLNGCTIKNLMIAEGEAMFNAIAGGRLQISNGFIRNVFLGSPTSKFCSGYLTFQDVSISINFSGATTETFVGNNSFENRHLSFDNCAIYAVGSVLNCAPFIGCVMTDTDIELHIANQNQAKIFPYCTLTDCRIQGKVSGKAPTGVESGKRAVFGRESLFNPSYEMDFKWDMHNCVIDVDISESEGDANDYFDAVLLDGASTNTTVICKSHRPTTGNYQYCSNWNYLTHEEMRNGATLNAKGFTVVEIVDGD